MTYIPDFRTEGNIEKLNERDRNFLYGIMYAKEQAENFFDNLDIYLTEFEEKIVNELKLKDCLINYMDMQEKDAVLHLFEGADYLPEDVDLEDVGNPFARKDKENEDI